MKDKQDYTFEKLWKDLHDGFQIIYSYNGRKYILYKIDNNSYRQELLHFNAKESQPRFSMLSLKRVKEIYEEMEDIEYKV